MKVTIFFSFLFCQLIVVAQPQQLNNTLPYYHIDNGGITKVNGKYYNNRPIYINNSNAFILGGEKPLLRFAKGNFLYGSQFFIFKRGAILKKVEDFSSIQFTYDAGNIKWILKDKQLGNLKIVINVLSLDKRTGYAVNIQQFNTNKNDTLISCFGGSQIKYDDNLSWTLDVMGHPEVLNWKFKGDDCKKNKLQIANNLMVSEVDTFAQNQSKRLFTVYNYCSATHIATRQCDALQIENLDKFFLSNANEYPISVSMLPSNSNKEVCWTVEAFDGNKNTSSVYITNPAIDFKNAIERVDAISKRFKLNTPDPYLNALAPMASYAVDGTWYPPVFVHGGMQWNLRFPGWRTIFGGTMLGWHERVKAQANFYIASQVKTSNKLVAKADSSLLLTGQHPDSRFYGVGRITTDQLFYNMQSEFFDQLVEEWRFTADTALEKILSPALELHLKWLADCFDPDDDGVYESYLNTWASDSQWYNGGGTAEETSYAYRAHLAARDMAKRKGDSTSVEIHNAFLKKIKKGFFEKIWIKSKGFSGAYIEQGGWNRVHENPWLYSIFLPIDADLTSSFNAVESLYYTEWALQNDAQKFGGKRVWTSNWVPGIWSVRELWPGDNYHLALAYFKAGLAEKGFDVLKGNFMHTAYNFLVPGNFGSIQGGIDFGDCLHPFTRAVVCGLFGFYPDLPNNNILISPQLPSSWNHADIAVPDYSCRYLKTDSKIFYTITTKAKANLTIKLPLQGIMPIEVLVNNKPFTINTMAGMDKPYLEIHLTNSNAATISFKYKKIEVTDNKLTFYKEVNSPFLLSTKKGEIVEIHDEQKVFSTSTFSKNILQATLSNQVGHHTFFIKTRSNGLSQWNAYHIKITDTAATNKEDQKNSLAFNLAKSVWKPIPLNTYFNGDVQNIYSPVYFTPRPNTVSARLGIDGYSPWTFPYWKSSPPSILLDSVNRFLLNDSTLKTSQGIAFKWAKRDSKNILFTSLWNNFPNKIDIPINESGKGISFLIAGSTNVMQCGIANAVIKLYYDDGTEDSLSLIPPINYWNLSPINSNATAPGQASRNDYLAPVDAFCLPEKLPTTIQLGKNCRALVLNRKLFKGKLLKKISLETLSQEVVVGMMGISILK